LLVNSWKLLRKYCDLTVERGSTRVFYRPSQKSQDTGCKQDISCLVKEGFMSVSKYDAQNQHMTAY